ncbi:MAG: SDR family NAD(P)-dependent oxidoreductase [Myxococcales bacterium]|nr:SDR family NAD(P)-dependent oxidoreductase [Myxococcales bacterium]
MRDLADKVFLVTGANTGIGRATAEALARRGATVFLGCRSAERAEPVLAAIRAAGGSAELCALDLASLASVRAAAEALLLRGAPLHALVNNAGVAGHRGLTVDGFEWTFGVNHLGPFLLTTLLLPLLRASAPARIVNVTSSVHRSVRRLDWDALRRPTRSLTGFHEYKVSKLANVLFTQELARGRAGAGVHSYAVHPGTVGSDMWREVPWPLRSILQGVMTSVEGGAETSLYCATSPEVAGDDGRYYERRRVARVGRLASDPALARELWERSLGWTRP